VSVSSDGRREWFVLASHEPAADAVRETLEDGFGVTAASVLVADPAGV